MTRSNLCQSLLIKWVVVLVAASMLVACLFSGFSPRRAEASPSRIPLLTVVGISEISATAPAKTPMVITRNSDFKAWFIFANYEPIPWAASVWVQIIDPNGIAFPAPPLPAKVTPDCIIPPRPQNGNPMVFPCTVIGNVPANAAGGSYGVHFLARQFDPNPNNPSPAFTHTETKIEWIKVKGPRVCYTPPSFDFGTATDFDYLRVNNCGFGEVLQWVPSVNVPWLSLASKGGNMPDWDYSLFQVAVNRAILPVGLNSAKITIQSNDPTGPKEVAVSATRPAVIAPIIPAQPTQAPPSQPAPPAGGGLYRYFPETQFFVRDGIQCPSSPATGANFLAEFSRLGELATLGYPASRPYGYDGFCHQVFQRGILQWRHDYAPGQAVLANTMDWLHQTGKDDQLFSKGVPRHFTGDDGAGGNFEKATQIRFGWMTDSAIRDAYFANPSPGNIPDALWDPVVFYGLPTSQPQSFGAFVTQRFQRYVFQKWVQAVPGMPSPGTVVGVLAGDLAKETGLVPQPAAQNEAAPL